MIAGLFLRHYKIYKGGSYIPFGVKQLENLNLFIGNNGAGKSSILEALDTFFNSRQFIVHNGEDRSAAFVAPLFIISEFDLKKFSETSKLLIKLISKELLVTIQESQNYKVYKQFFEQREEIVKKYPDHYVFLYGVGADQGKDKEVFIAFHNHIKGEILKTTEIDDEQKFQRALATFKSEILSFYSFQYIPVETSIEDFLRLESKGMQELMSEDVKKRIENTLSNKLYNGGKKQTSILETLNDNLDAFVKEVEKIIQGIDKDYSFASEYKAKTKLTSNHLMSAVMDSFFSRRTLKKAKKPIKDLSSGERKKALVDIAYAFLTQDLKRDKKIILAIDEPESSLHISMCYDQFERLDLLANRFENQLLITTHWYGALPIIEKGNLFHIDSTNSDIPIISEFSFKNYFENRGGHPEDIQFKSFFDLSSAIISSLRVKECNWLIVESEEDKKYIEKHLTKKLNIKILPVGGCAIVKLLYKYLYTPISHNSDSKVLKGKIFCLIDTDKQGIGIRDASVDLKNKTLTIRRLQLDQNRIKLLSLDNSIRSETEIEDSLISNAFYEALSTSIKNSEDDLAKEAFAGFKFDNDVQNSFIRGDDSIIFPIRSEGNQRKQKQIIVEFINKNKSIICDNYCNLNITESLGWVNEIEDYFSK